MSERKYRIICLKRSECKMEDGYFRWKYPIYWMPNRSGYTECPISAGIYTAAMAEECSGSKGDWVLEPVSREERYPKLYSDRHNLFIEKLDSMKSMCDDWDAAGEPV